MKDVRNFIIMAFLLSVNMTVSSQRNNINVPNIEMDSRYVKVYHTQHGTIQLTDTEFHLLDINSGVMKRVTADDSGCLNCIPIYGAYSSSDSLYLHYLDMGSDSLVLISNLHDRNGSFLESSELRLDFRKNYCSFSKAKRFQDDYYLCITCDSIATGPNLYALLKFKDSGSMSVVGVKKSDGIGIPSGVFNLRFVKDIEIMGDDKILVSGNFSHSLFLGTFNFDEIFVGQVRYYDSTINELIWSWDPHMSKIAGDIVIGTCNYPYRNVPGFQEHYLRISVTNDSFKIDTLLIIPNPDDIGKFGGNNVNLDDNTIVTYSNEDLWISSDKSNVPSRFFLSRMDDDQFIWQKSFGGDHYYRVKDIERIDSCSVIIVGSVYNYYGDDLLHGFYSIIDCDGNFATSSDETNTQETLVFPNPSSGIMYLGDEELNTFELDVYSQLGIKVMSIKMKGNQLDLSSLPTGYYILSLKSKGASHQKSVLIIK